MSTMMTTLVVLRPGGDAPETFHDSRIEAFENGTGDRRSGTLVYVYSYAEQNGGDLKIYRHLVPWRDYGILHKFATEGEEVAHFRSRQWQTVRAGDS